MSMNMRAKDKGQGGIGTGVSGGQWTEKINTTPGSAAALTQPEQHHTVEQPEPRCTVCDCRVELDDPTSDEPSWIHAEDGDWGDHTAEGPEIYPCGHVAIQPGCGGCDPAAVEYVIDDNNPGVLRAYEPALDIADTASAEPPSFPYDLYEGDPDLSEPVNAIEAATLPEDAKTYTAAPDPTDPFFPGRAAWPADGGNDPYTRDGRFDLATGYAPHEYVTPKILARVDVGGPKNVDPSWQRRWEREVQWADGNIPQVVDTPYGRRPLNPAGATGLTGLGGCKRLGENKAADPVVTRTDPATGKTQILLGYKATEQQWCLPGGTVDEGETAAQACSRELEEEVGLRVDMAQGEVLYRGFVDDHRNTDNAWFATEARHVHLTGAAANQEPTGSDDIAAARWVDLDQVTPETMFASHGHIVAPLLGRSGRRS